ncbi:hypothetical protein BH24PSE2_BH24PSE2_17600 [soil metagenome]
MIQKFLLILIAAMSLGLGACEPQGPAEEMGEDVDEGVDEMGDDMEEMGDDMEDDFDN